MARIPGDDPDVLALQDAARSLSRRGATDARIVHTVTDALARPLLQLPENFKATHETGGLPGFPAIDLFAEPQLGVLPPEDGELVWPHLIPWSKVARVGGWTCYWQGVSGNTYFLTHFAELAEPGAYRKGHVIGTVAGVPGGWWPSHIHEGKHKGRYNPLGV